MEFEIPGGRGNEIKLTQTCTLIDESYNSSTEAAINAIRTAGLYEGKKLIVLGGMKELGSETMLSHEKVLNEALKLKDTDIILVGEEFINASHNLKKDILSFQTSNDLIHNFTKEKALEYNVVLVKSSKSVYLSKFSESLKN
jgi:UDP-N-acetylmuramoyl-tripeptide--D-alanyl-D-alanine ligase